MSAACSGLVLTLGMRRNSDSARDRGILAVVDGAEDVVEHEVLGSCWIMAVRELRRGCARAAGRACGIVVTRDCSASRLARRVVGTSVRDERRGCGRAAPGRTSPSPVATTSPDSASRTSAAVVDEPRAVGFDLRLDDQRPPHRRLPAEADGQLAADAEPLAGPRGGPDHRLVEHGREHPAVDDALEADVLGRGA